MSLDTLFQQILLTEQQISEKTRQSQEVKAAIARCQDRVKSLTAKSECLSKELDEKAQHLSETKLHYDLMKKRQVQVEKQAGELLRQQKDLRKHLETIKKSSKEEQEKFMKEIMTFNSDFSLLNNRETVFESQTQSEIQMESMGRKNTRMNSMQEEKRGLHLELQGLEHIMRDLESQLNEAKSMTESLSAESLMVTQKPLTDSTCLRLKKELEMHKEGELELLREALSSEILLLQSVITLSYSNL
ncbi:coiled-coil domain-containing protein 172-like [Salvelinus alpinus]